MSLPKNFEHQAAEQRWYAHWQHKGYFSSSPDKRPAYTIVMPPPNVTGALHMGHALNNTVQDVLIRRAKAHGFNTCWVPGTDHASIATEAKVVNMLQEKGIDKNTLSRDQFLAHAWDWKEEYGGIILKQLKHLGCSLDWDRTAFTMDPEYYATVLKVFVDLYRKGKIYRGVKMVNWDPQALTALSDEEVLFKETNGFLVHIRYKIAGSEDYITIATTRPETIMGDTAVCVHPSDPRYAHLRGHNCIVPLINKEIPIIYDEYIDMEYGTGALKVTPAHDINDYNLGLTHHLEVVDTLNADGTMSVAAQLYVGQDRFAVRKQIVKDLEAAGALVKNEPYQNQVGVSERTGAVVEPRLSMQWWCDVQDIAKPALQAVMEDTIAFFPPKYKNLYRHWMANIKDWCISRQLWWGQRIPAWYAPGGELYVAASEAEAIAQYLKKNPQGKAEDLRQDEDVLDTWFSSWLWPLQVFGWNMEGSNKELNYYYPTNTLVTAPDIIFFWVARMVMAGYEFKHEKPFKDVYFTGLIRDKQGRKMSKQLGNSPDLLKLIEEFGADVVRFSVMIASPAGSDILYDEGHLDQGKFFVNKIWNALKLVQMWGEKQNESVDADTFALDWMQARIAIVSQEVDALYENYKLSEALKVIYSLIWNDFCSWYLEWAKPGYEEPISKTIYEGTIAIFEQLLQLLHPFLPFATEEIYHLLKKQDIDLMVKQAPKYAAVDVKLLQEGTNLQETITAVRELRQQLVMKPKETLDLYYDGNLALSQGQQHLLAKQVNAAKLEAVAGRDKAAMQSLVLDTQQYYVNSHAEVDIEQQNKKVKEEILYLEGFINSLNKKLGNEKFMANAKSDVIANEQKKKADAAAKIDALQASLQ